MEKNAEAVNSIKRYTNLGCNFNVENIFIQCQNVESKVS